MSNKPTDPAAISDQAPKPEGELALQTIAMPANTNPRGDIFAGWLVSQMDLAASIAALKVSRSRVATVAIKSMDFLRAVHVGAVISCYADVVDIGRSSIRINIEVWINHPVDFSSMKVTEGEFVFVAIDENGRTQPVKG